MKEWAVTHLLKFRFRSLIYGMVNDHRGNIYWSTSIAGSGTWKLNVEEYPPCLFNCSIMDFCGMVWNKDDKLYASRLSGELFEYNTNTDEVTSIIGKQGKIQSNYHLLRGITIDKNGDLFCTGVERGGITMYTRNILKIDMKNHTIEKVHYEGSVDVECTEGDFLGIGITDDGTLLVCDWKYHCIQQIKDGQLSVFAGKFEEEGGEDGSLQECRFSYPVEMTWDNEGNLLVGDSNGIRKIDMKRKTVTTIVKDTTEQVRCHSLAVDEKGTIFFGTNYGHVFRAENIWMRERLLWIGHLKEDANYCYLAKMPKDVIREISSFLLTGTRLIRDPNW